MPTELDGTSGYHARCYKYFSSITAVPRQVLNVNVEPISDELNVGAPIVELFSNDRQVLDVVEEPIFDEFDAGESNAELFPNGRQQFQKHV